MITTLYKWFYVLLGTGAYVWEFFTTPMADVLAPISDSIGSDIINGGFQLQILIDALNFLFPNYTMFDFILGAGIGFVLAFSLVKWFVDLIA